VTLAKRSRIEEAKLDDGKYIAECREATLIGAAANGHSQIWPKCEMLVQGDRAFFYREGKLLWDCNAAYAADHFDISPLLNA